MTPFTLPLAELKPALIGLSKVIAKRTTLPVLGTVKLERTADGWIALTGTDLDYYVTVRLEQPGNGEPATLLIPYEELLKTSKACGSGDEILVDRSGQNLTTLKYRIGQQFVETQVESLPVEEFPEIPRFKGDAVALPPALCASINEALQCASSDESRLILNGCYLDVSKPDAHYVVGTDGRHLYSSNSFTVALDASLMIPNHKFLSWKEFNTDGEWQLKIAPAAKKDDPSYLQLSSRRWRMISRQIDGNYPNWRQVVPDTFAGNIEFDPDVRALLQTIAQMPCDDSINFALGLEMKDRQVSLIGRSPNASEWTRIALENVRTQGPDLRVFLNRHLLAKALQFGLTKLEFIDARSPVRLSCGGRQIIIMPTRPEPAPRPPVPPIPANPAAQPQPEPPQETTTSAVATGAAQTNAPTTQTPTKVVEKPALEMALAQLEILRGDFRSGLAGLNKLSEALKQAQREHKTSDKDLQSVRQTLRSLQSVRI